MSAVRWHGVTAEYGATERAFVRTLARRARLEAWRLHVLKALLDASTMPENAALTSKRVEGASEGIA